MPKIAVVSTHPIQYNAPIFRLLEERRFVSIKVFYTWGEAGLNEKFDPGFGRIIKWDIPLLDGYDFEVLKNVAKSPGSDRFGGIDNPDILERIKEYNPDSVLVFGWAFKSHLKVMRYFKGRCMVLFRGDSTMLDNISASKKLLRKIVLRWVYKHIDLAIYVGKNNRAYYKEFGLKDNQLVFAPHAVDNERFGNGSEDYREVSNRIRHDLGISSNEFVFVFAGKLDKVKNVDLLLNAFSVSTIHSKAKLVIVGNGPLENGFKERFGNDPRIQFLPFQNQKTMPAIYRLGNFYVLPSISETWGLAINEALACGTPVIASDNCGGAPDLLIDGKNGFVFKSNDQLSLQQTLEKAFDTSANDYQSLVQNAKIKIADFTFERIAKSIEGIVCGKDSAFVDPDKMKIECVE